VPLHQLLVGAAPGDAVTRDALALREALRADGPSEVFARHIEPTIAHDVLRLEDLPGPGSTHELLVHLSIGDPDVLARVEEERDPIVLRYHNVSPAGFFAHDPPFAALLELGREAVGHLARRTRLALADSPFNAAELVAAGYDDVRVVPPVCPWPDLMAQPSHKPLAHHLDVMVNGPVVLCVAQVLPHKRLDLVLAAFHLFATYHEPRAQLVVVGAHRDPVHVRALLALQRELNLPNVWFAGVLTDSELATCYRRADVLVTMSDHEGFCVPVVEAMAFGVPVVARGTTAVPGTLGSAGLVLPADAGPTVTAEALALVVGDRALRADLVARGLRRADDFHPTVVLDAFRAALAAPVGSVG
jgi:L-malate glycosyltransferase